MNLLQETLGAITEAKLTPDRITFIGASSGSHGCTWEEFKEIADIEYDEGYGGQEVADDLVVVFDNGAWLSRSEYDGAEWWTYRKKPRVPGKYAPLTRLVRGGYQRGLGEMNR